MYHVLVCNRHANQDVIHRSLQAIHTFLKKPTVESKDEGGARYILSTSLV